VHFSASEARNVDTLFFMLRWDQYGFDKKCIGTSYAELLFLHPVGSVGDIVHFGASGWRIIDTLFFKLRWDWCGFAKSASGHVMPKFCFSIRCNLQVKLCISVRLASKSSRHYSLSSGGTGTDLTKSALGHVTLNFCFCLRWDLRVT
jgi:hypothetical protein